MCIPRELPVDIFNGNRHAGYWDFSLFGRAPTAIPADAAFLGKKDIEGATCYILKSETQNGGSQRIWVDGDKDFCVRKIERHSPTGELYGFTLFKMFERFGEIWVPRIREITSYREDGTLRAKLRTEITAAAFNVDFPPDFFLIDRDFYQPPQRPPRPDPRALPDAGPTR